MKKIKRIKKAYTTYGTKRGYYFLKLFYTYHNAIKELGEKNHSRDIPKFNEAFFQYVDQDYDIEFANEYRLFHQNNMENKKLLKAMRKKKENFLIPNILQLIAEITEPEQKRKAEKEKPKKKDEISAVTIHESSHKTGLQQQGTVSTPTREYRFLLNTSVGRLYDTFPASNIDYIPYAPAKKKNYKFTMKRLFDGTEYIEYHSGKDMDEAMKIANGISFDRAKIIKVEEEKT